MTAARLTGFSPLLAQYLGIRAGELVGAMDKGYIVVKLTGVMFYS